VRRVARKDGTFIDLGTFAAPGLVDRRARLYVPSKSKGEPSTALRPRARLLVMFDGQNAFGDEGSFAGGWHADVAVEKLAAKIAPVILAIDHGGADRIAELSLDGSAPSTKLARLIDLVVDSVLPAAHDRTPLAYGPAAHYICGSSMGGLGALAFHFRRPEVFGGAIAMSPSLWFARRGIFELAARESNPYRSRVYLDAGAREAGGRLVTIVDAFADSLRKRGWQDHGDLRVMNLVDPRGTHQESAWRRRLPKALRFTFGA
jgi:predicted alpha/beta superfamily hydrolase